MIGPQDDEDEKGEKVVGCWQCRSVAQHNLTPAPAAGVFISGIAKGSAADDDGQLRVGDEILAANNVSLSHRTQRDARDIIQESNKVHLLVNSSPQAHERYADRFEAIRRRLEADPDAQRAPLRSHTEDEDEEEEEVASGSPDEEVLNGRPRAIMPPPPEHNSPPPPSSGAEESRDDERDPDLEAANGHASQKRRVRPPPLIEMQEQSSQTAMEVGCDTSDLSESGSPTKPDSPRPIMHEMGVDTTDTDEPDSPVAARAAKKALSQVGKGRSAPSLKSVGARVVSMRPKNDPAMAIRSGTPPNSRQGSGDFADMAKKVMAAKSVVKNIWSKKAERKSSSEEEKPLETAEIVFDIDIHFPITGENGGGGCGSRLRSLISVPTPPTCKCPTSASCSPRARKWMAATLALLW
jgi:hypothetical protein